MPQHHAPHTTCINICRNNTMYMERIQYKNQVNNIKHVTRCPTGVMCLMITCICAVSTSPQSMQTHHPMPDGCGVHDDHMHMGVKKPTSAQVRKCASVQVCKCASAQVRKRASAQVRSMRTQANAFTNVAKCGRKMHAKLAQFPGDRASQQLANSQFTKCKSPNANSTQMMQIQNPCF